MLWYVGLLVLTLMESSYASLSPTGINYEGKFLCPEFSFIILTCPEISFLYLAKPVLLVLFSFYK